MELLPQNVTEELVKAQLKVYLQSNEGESFAENVLSKHLNETIFNRRFHESWLRNHIDQKMREIYKEILGEDAIGRVPGSEIFIAGLVKVLENAGYKVTIEKN